MILAQEVPPPNVLCIRSHEGMSSRVVLYEASRSIVDPADCFRSTVSVAIVIR